MDINNSNSNQSQGTKKYMDFVRSSGPNPIKPKTVAKSNTLMRSVVSKPTNTTHINVSTSSLQNSEIKVHGPITRSTSIHSVKAKPSIRSRQVNNSLEAPVVQKHEKVDRFGAPAVKAVSEAELNMLTKPSTTHLEPALHTAPEPAKQNIISRDKMMFENSVKKAFAAENNHHKTKKHSSTMSKLATAGIFALVLLVVAGGLSYHYLNRVSLYLASTKAGFSATSPTYSPSGYGIANVSYAKGIVSSEYHSNTDNRSYNISEKTTTWNNTDLVNNYVSALSNDDYVTINSNGLTIYLYGTRNATWINNGIWYIITSNNSLSDQQMVHLATSM